MCGWPEDYELFLTMAIRCGRLCARRLLCISVTILLGSGRMGHLVGVQSDLCYHGAQLAIHTTIHGIYHWMRDHGLVCVHSWQFWHPGKLSDTKYYRQRRADQIAITTQLRIVHFTNMNHGPPAINGEIYELC